jgi:hypothetical protein
MPRKFLWCTKHVEGPLDVWYDCFECGQGSKEDALKHVRWLDKKQIEELLQSSPSPTLPPDAGQISQERSCSRPVRGA